MSGFLDLSVLPVDGQQLLVCKEEPPEQHELSPTEPEHMKEEQEDLWNCNEEERFHGPQGNNIIEFTFSPVFVKSEDDEERPQSSQLHPRRIKQLEQGGDRWDCGGSEKGRVLDLERHLRTEAEVKAKDLSEPETDDSADWKDTGGYQSSKKSVGNNNSKRKKTEVKSYSCPQCGKTCQTKSSLTVHMRSHTVEKPFSCSDCGKAFKRKKNLTVHTMIHSGEKRFGCSQCGKKFIEKGHLVRHMVVHTRDKSFSCSECSKKFDHKESMTRHMRIHTKEKPFSCSECEERFNHRESLIRHMISHSKVKPYCCTECGKRFDQMSTLTRHTRTHTGEKPFGCSECGKRFSRRFSLTLHMENHSGQKPFSCNICGQNFCRSFQLKLHKCVKSPATVCHKAEKKRCVGIGADGEDCRGPQTAWNSDPERGLHAGVEVKIEDSPPETNG